MSGETACFVHSEVSPPCTLCAVSEATLAAFRFSGALTDPIPGPALQPMDGLEDFLHTSMLDYPAFGDPLATSSSSSWKPTHADSAGTWQPAGHDQYQGVRQPLP